MVHQRSDVCRGDALVAIDVGIRVLWRVGNQKQAGDNDGKIHLIDTTVPIDVADERRGRR